MIGSTAPEVAALAFVGHQLYGVAVKPGSQTSQLLKIDPATSQITIVGNIGFAVTGLAYDLVRQSLYGTTAKQLISINPVTGSGRPVMSVADQSHNCGEIAFDRKGNTYITLIGADRRKFLAACDLSKGNVKSIGDIGFPNLASMKFYDELPQTTPVSPTPPSPSTPQPISPGVTTPANLGKTPTGSVSPSSPQPSVPDPTTPVTLGKTPTGSSPLPQQRVPVNLQTISFDSFARDPQQDIICVTPVRTIVRREEEITLIRKVRKVEDIDVSPACPTNTT